MVRFRDGLIVHSPLFQRVLQLFTERSWRLLLDRSIQVKARFLSPSNEFRFIYCNDLFQMRFNSAFDYYFSSQVLESIPLRLSFLDP